MDRVHTFNVSLSTYGGSTTIQQRKRTPSIVRFGSCTPLILLSLVSERGEDGLGRVEMVSRINEETKMAMMVVRNKEG